MDTYKDPSSLDAALFSSAVQQARALQDSVRELYWLDQQFRSRLTRTLAALDEELGHLVHLAAEADSMAPKEGGADEDGAASSEEPLLPWFFPFDDTVRCIGWHAPELDGLQRLFRWSGPGTESFAVLPLPRLQPAALVIHAVHGVDEGFAHSLRVAVDGAGLPTEVRRAASDWEVSVRLPARDPQLPGPTEIGIRVPRTVAPAGAGGTAEARLLGIAVRGFSVLPMAAPDGEAP